MPWNPPEFISREKLVAESDRIMGSPDISLKIYEDVFRVESVGLEWDMGVMVYEPAEASSIALGADEKKIGIFLLHGGDGDFKSMDRIARLYAGKFGHKVVSMTFPGRLYLDDASRDWPGDTVHADGTVRTPKWKRGEDITPDQYDVIVDETLRHRYGRRVVARAKPGSIFYYRMAGWPMAFEAGMKDAMRRHFPPGEFSIYVSGHSTGGPICFMISQRVPNIAGVIAAEHSAFGFIQRKQHDWSGALGKIPGFDRVASEPAPRTDPFNELYIRTWRDCARYAGPEALGREGPAALMRLPWLMEEVLDWWDQEKQRPQFKAEYIITHEITGSLVAAARATAERLKLSEAETEKLVDHYKGFPHPQRGAGAKPVPNTLFIIAKDSRDHSPEVYREVVLPMFSQIRPAPRVEVTRMDASTHFYTRAEPDLPFGIGPNIASLYNDAIQSGYFLER